MRFSKFHAFSASCVHQGHTVGAHDHMQSLVSAFRTHRKSAASIDESGRRAYCHPTVSSSAPAPTLLFCTVPAFFRCSVAYAHPVYFRQSCICSMAWVHLARRLQLNDFPGVNLQSETSRHRTPAWVGFHTETLPYVLFHTPGYYDLSGSFPRPLTYRSSILHRSASCSVDPSQDFRWLHHAQLQHPRSGLLSGMPPC